MHELSPSLDKASIDQISEALRRVEADIAAHIRGHATQPPCFLRERAELLRDRLKAAKEDAK
jgi:hypothetical protein